MVVLNKFIKKIKEEALGLKNGVNKIFTSSFDFKDDSLVVLCNGQDMTKDIDFSIMDSDRFSFIYVVPKPEDILNINYIKK